MRILNRASTSSALSHIDCVAALEPAMCAVSKQKTVMPLRQYMDIPGGPGKFTLMPGYLETPRTFGVKIVSKFPRKFGSPYGSHVGAVMIFDPVEGTPVGLVDGAELTAIRTASASALATRVLSRTDSRVLAVLGSGTQALHHIKALQGVRQLSQVRLWSRNEATCMKLVKELELRNETEITVCDSAENAVAVADIVCTTTASPTPILEGRWLRPGTHVNLVGAAVKTSAEADVDVVRRSRFYVDYRESAFAQAGELHAAIESRVVDRSHIVGEIGEVLLQRVGGRRNRNEITCYKSLGVAAQDLAAGLAAIENASRLNLGIEIDWM